MGENVNLEMLQKLVLSVKTELQSLRTSTEQGFADLNRKVDGMAQTLLDVRRDVRSVQGEMATLGAAVAGHSRRLERIEKDDDDRPHA